MRSFSRLDNSPLARWFWTVDRVGVALVLTIAMIGVTLLFAAGPGAAARLKIENSFHFPIKQLIFLAPALLLMIAVSMLTPLQARRLGVAVFVGAIIAMVATVVTGDLTNGARRWLSIGPFSFQPSEFAKPGFVVLAAWMLAEGKRSAHFPGAAIAFGLYLVFMALLVLEPDYGQAALVTAVWGAMFFIVGGAWIWIAGLMAVGASGIAFGYFFSPHLAKRIDAFLSPGSANSYQVDKALEAIREGGPFGTMAEGASVKYQLPDAHTDFIFSVAGEEHGFILCVVIIALYAGLVMHFLKRAAALKSLFAQCAVAGLSAMIGLQAFINIGVNLRLLPAKGMTLPFISYGGSSLLAMGLVFGLIFALSRSAGSAVRRKEIMP
jgi:cell division protein FtsW